MPRIHEITAMGRGAAICSTKSDEEVVAWTTELTGPIGISYTEAVKVIRAEGARQWRPRPGEFVELIQHHRRQDALRKRRPALPSGIRIASKEMNDEWNAKRREMVKGRATR
jgi:hypothetical protein